MAVPRQLDFTAGGWAVNEIPQAIPPSQPLVTRCRTGSYASRLTWPASGPLQPEQTPAADRGSHRNRLSRSDAAARRTGLPRRPIQTGPGRSTGSPLSATSNLNAPQPPPVPARPIVDDEPTPNRRQHPSRSLTFRSQTHPTAWRESSINPKPRRAPSQDTSLERITATCGATGDALSDTPIIVSSFTSFAA